MASSFCMSFPGYAETLIFTAPTSTKQWEYYAINFNINYHQLVYLSSCLHWTKIKDSGRGESQKLQEEDDIGPCTGNKC